MPKFLISATFTVAAEDEDDGKYLIGQCISAALCGEPGPIEDYSVEDVLEVYNDDGSIILLKDGS